MIAALLLAVPSLSHTQNATQNAATTDLLKLKFSPGKWWHEVEGDVRSIETVGFRLIMKNGRWVEERLSSKTSYFDRRGFETEMVENEEAKMVWKYDAEGRVSEMTMWLAGAPIMREVYLYDLTKRKVTTEVYAFGGDELHSREVALFDERWNQTRQEKEFFETAGNPRRRKEVTLYTQTYDSKGRPVVSTVEKEDGTLLHKFVSEYDDASNRLLKTVGYEYDQSGVLTTKYVNTYDARGHLKEGLYYDPRGRLKRRETYTREFDARGNWITEKETTWAGDVPGTPTTFTLIKRRKITFY